LKVRLHSSLLSGPLRDSWNRSSHAPPGEAEGERIVCTAGGTAAWAAAAVANSRVQNDDRIKERVTRMAGAFMIF
jgi:hypothetical protein